MTSTTQQAPFLELVIRGARLVQGHPMQAEQRKKDDVAVFNDDGTPSMETYICLAVPKDGTTHWDQIEWGQLISARAVQDWPNGEFQQPAFAWKIEDGDSTIPNKNGKKNADREGFPGHWIIKGSTLRVVKAWDGATSADLIEVLDKAAIKTGDYCDVAFQVKGNGPAKSPGVYLNPTHFVFTRAGTALAGGSGSSAADLFGRATTGLSPAAAAPAPVVAPPAAGIPAPVATVAPPAAPSAAPAPIAAPAPVVAPHDFLNAAPAPVAPPAPVEDKFSYNGEVYTRAALEAANWPAESINALPRA